MIRQHQEFYKKIENEELLRNILLLKLFKRNVEV